MCRERERDDRERGWTKMKTSTNDGCEIRDKTKMKRVEDNTKEIGWCSFTYFLSEALWKMQAASYPPYNARYT